MLNVLMKEEELKKNMLNSHMRWEQVKKLPVKN